MKKMILSSLIMSVSVLSLISCNDKGNDAPVAFQDRVPEKLTFSVPPQGEMPSDAQLKEIQATFQNQNKMMLPPGELMYPDDLTASEVSKKEAKLKIEDPNSYKMLKEIQANCTASRPVNNNNFPKDGQTVEVKAGDIFTIDIKANVTSKSGACPMTSKGEMNAKIIVEEYEKDSQKIKKLGMSMGAGAKVEYLVTKPEYQKLLSARGMIVDTNISGLTSIVEPNQKMYVTANLSGSYVTLDKQIDYTTTFEVAGKSAVNGSSSKSELVAKAELKFPNFRVSIVTHTISEGNVTTLSEVYLNGNKLNTNQQQKILNREIPGIGVSEQSKLLNALK